MTSALDDALVNKAAPAGSMRYFSLLYTPPEHREIVTALYVIDAEIRESAQSPNHDVAHTRLQWWRQEIDRLVNRNAQHPATRILGAVDRVDRKAFARLHELIVAADMDLARMTFLNLRELRAYSSRSGGTIQELIAEVLAPAELSKEDRTLANRLGAGIRQAEMLRDTRQDAYDGRLYLPLDLLEEASVHIEDLRAREVSPVVRGVLVKFREAIAPDLDVPAGAGKAYLRPPIVLAALHRRLLDRIAALDYDVATQRVELGAIEKPWTAWRAARRAR
ncbi:phytoene synthase [Povalibacter uvarum]|uniref:Phytoene synthase n=1 Tax=Povalibacter uvarum TaxID=732238 RepID=A0A841HHZ1_9GAMM|nr:squalene/phytoene synthase family protein [Povalibacter uvarum]MBB6091930.1 phytoene synthase [Povalibacter uvarum]